MPYTVPRSSPSSQGVDPTGIEAFLDDMEADPQVEMHSLMLLRNGHVVTEGWWAPYGPDRVHLLYSLSKSFTSTAAGFAVAEGLLDLDRTVVSYFPEFDADITDERSRSILVRHVAAMASGHHTETIEQAMANDPAEPVRGFLMIPPEHEPGSWFAYNQPCTYALAAIIQRESGQRLVDYLRPRLFDPLGIGPVGWQHHPNGRDLGFTGLHASTDAIAKLGQLYLQRGWWGDRRLLPGAWVDEATAKQVDNPGEENPDWSQGYGFQFWMARHGYRGDGAYGQFCVVLPEYDAVVAITGASIDMQAVLDGLWTHLLPAFGDDHRSSPDRTAADLHLARRMSSLELAPAAGKSEPEEAADEWDGAVFRPAGGLCEPQATLQSVDLQRVGDGWRVTLAEPDHRLTGILTGHGWSTTDESSVDGSEQVPVAVSGGWDGGRLIADVQFLETPHRLTLSCDLAVGTFSATWATVPLRTGTLQDLRKPA
ncbi:MAG TPA: serine hydrolase domain-containing protein [Microlunatus sp.]|nr:serine hydrolase domain-containing protein [Microlunatus sp.]